MFTPTVSLVDHPLSRHCLPHLSLDHPLCRSSPSNTSHVQDHPFCTHPHHHISMVNLPMLTRDLTLEDGPTVPVSRPLPPPPLVDHQTVPSITPTSTAGPNAVTIPSDTALIGGPPTMPSRSPPDLRGGWLQPYSVSDLHPNLSMRAVPASTHPQHCCCRLVGPPTDPSPPSPWPLMVRFTHCTDPHRGPLRLRGRL